ncbi:hypothetical protein A5663_20665 [Mycobacterium sp. E740]|nr:hypothetical protein A5663_20665 [Mycobacterium sp. E740]
MTAMVLSIGLPGCGPVRETAEDITEVAVESTVEAPDAALAGNAVVAQAARSVVKIHTVAESCQKTLDGSGVVIAPNKVMSAAHAVAGADTVSVWVGDTERPARVVVFDPKMDISVLDVPDLRVPPLPLDQQTAMTGADALVLGYPGGGPFVATPARVRKVIELLVPDIYHTTTVNREVYVIRGPIRHGGSGGPLIDLNGRVLGISFGAAVDDPDTGFVVTAREVFKLLAAGVGAPAPVAPGVCVP